MISEPHIMDSEIPSSYSQSHHAPILISPTTFRKPLPLSSKLAFSVGHFLNDLCASMWFTYLLVFFHLVLEFDNTLAGVILLVGQIADGLATAWVGLQVGNVSPNPGELSIVPKKWWNIGPRKSWHLAGTIAILISFPFIFMPCLGCSTSSPSAQLIYFAAFVVVFQLGWASVQISHLSLIPVLTYDEESRTELTAWRYACTVLANVLVYALTWLLLGLAGASQRVIAPEDASRFRDVVFISLGLGTLTSLWFQVGVPEESQTNIVDDDDVPLLGQDKKPVMTPSTWLKQAQFYQVALLYMATRLFVNLSQVYLPLYLQDSLALGATSVATTPLALFISGFLSSLLMRPMTRWVGRKWVYLIGTLLGIGACVLVWSGQGDWHRTYGVYIVASLFGAGGSTMLITSLSITADMIGPHVESGAFVYGAMSFTDKLSNGGAVMIIQYLHPCQACCPECTTYYVRILAYVCGGAGVLALLSLASLIPTKIGVNLKGYSSLSVVVDDDSSDSSLVHSDPGTSH